MAKEKKESSFKAGCLGCLGILVILAIVVGGCSMIMFKDDKKEVDYSKMTIENVEDAIVNDSEFNDIHQTITEIEIVEENILIVRIDTAADESVDLNTIKMFMLDDMQVLQKFDEIGELRILFSTLFKDKYGETSYDHALSGKIKGEELRKINFENTTTKDLDNLVDYTFISPLLK